MGTQARVRRQRRWQGNRAQEATRGRVEDGHRILVDAPDEDPAGGLVDGERRTVHFPGAPPRPPGAQRDRAQDAQARRIDSEQGGRRIAEGEDEEAMAPRVGRQVRVQRERLGREGRGGGPDRAAGGEVDRRDRHPRPARARRGRPGHERAPQPRVVGDGEPRASAGPGAGPPHRERPDHAPGRRVDDPRARAHPVHEDSAAPRGERERRGTGDIGDGGHQGIRPRRWPHRQRQEDRQRPDDHPRANSPRCSRLSHRIPRGLAPRHGRTLDALARTLAAPSRARVRSRLSPQDHASMS